MLFLLSSLGCAPPPPPPILEPFISEMLVGRWLGTWSAELPGQNGVADVLVAKHDDLIEFDLSISGGAIASEDDPLLMILSGRDDTTELSLDGFADVAGFVTLLIDPDGNISGTVDPDSLPPVDIIGWVRDYEFTFSFAVFGIIPGELHVYPVND